MFSGRLIRDKGVLEYLKAASIILKKFPKREFWLIGELGANNKTALSKKQLEYYTNKFPQIKYLGKTDDINNILNDIDVVVLPSYREGLSRSLIEAAAMRIPIITTDVPGCKDVVTQDYNGILCKVKCEESLAKSMEKMINITEKERHNMGVNGRRLTEKFFLEEKVIQDYAKQINKLSIGVK